MCAKFAKLFLEFDTGDDKSMDDQERDVFKRAPVWEIWDKEERKIIFIADSYKDAPLKIEDDPLGLDGFFPIARPMYSVRSTKSLIPVPEYTLYEDQAKELDRISGRINKLVNVMKMRGIYDSTLSDLKRIFRYRDKRFGAAYTVHRPSNREKSV